MRGQGQYGDPAANNYGSAQMHLVTSPRMETKSGTFEGRLEAFTPDRENPYDNSKLEGQGGEGARSYFQGQRPDPKLALQNQSNNDSRSQALEEGMDVGFEGNHLSQTFEGVEQKFLDDIMKLAKEHNDAEDAENARHREKINAVNAQYEEKLAALRARHASRRDEFLRRESHARQLRYQLAIRDPYPGSGMAPNDPHVYSAVNASTAVGEVQRGYPVDHFDPYREQARFLGGARDQGFEPRGPYPAGRVYDTASRYYN